MKEVTLVPGHLKDGRGVKMAPKQEGPWSVGRLPAAGGAACVEGEHATLWDGAVPVLTNWPLPGPWSRASAHSGVN